MKKVYIITGSIFYDFQTKEYHIGGIQTYIRKLVMVLIAAKYLPFILNTGDSDQSGILDNGATYLQVAAKKGDMKALVRKAEEKGDIDEDLLLFSTSNEIVKSHFKHVLGIQHGIYWDTDVIRGIKLKSLLSMAILRGAQMILQINWHRMVGTLVCVDVNYVNWMRATAGNFGLKYVYIPNCADKPTKEKTEFGDSKIRILYARRFVRQRGIDLLMKALPPILDRFPNVLLTIAGQGEGLTQLHAAFDKYGERVTFTQYDAMKSVDFHLSYDIAMVPSLYSEGTSLSLLEAMSAGCACIATDIGGLSNVIINRHNGILIRPIADDLQKAVVYLIEREDQRKYLAENAIVTIRDSFSSDLWTERWTHFLSEYYPAD